MLQKSPMITQKTRAKIQTHIPSSLPHQKCTWEGNIYSPPGYTPSNFPKGIKESCQGADLEQNNTVLVKQESLPLTTTITPDQFPGRQSNQVISLIRSFYEGFICSCLARTVHCQPSSGMFERLRNNRFQGHQFRRTSGCKGPDPAIGIWRATSYTCKPLVIELRLCTQDSSCPWAPHC